MTTKAENVITESIEDEHLLDTNNSKKREKKVDTKSFKNLKSSIALKSASNANKKLSNKLKQINSITKTKTKKVKFNKEIIIIDVECWKKYNLEQTADENFDDYLDEIQNDDKNDSQNKKEKKNNQKNKSKDTITCTCIII